MKYPLDNMGERRNFQYELEKGELVWGRSSFIIVSMM